MAKLDKGMHVGLSDAHGIFVDKRAWKSAVGFVRDQRPGHVHLIGDMIDFYGLSKFLKDPSRKYDLQYECDFTYDLLAEIREAAGDATIRFSEGNHENRLKRFLLGNAPALAELRALTVPELLRFDDLGIKWHSQDQDPYRIGPCVVAHGELVRKRSGSTAIANIEKYGTCFWGGHTHRLAKVNYRNATGTYGGYENGCLCQLNPEYVRCPDWQQGWGVLTIRRKFYHMDTVEYVDGQYMYLKKLSGRRLPTMADRLEDVT